MRLDSEANIQAEFYHQARLSGLNCVLEIDTPAGRIDAAIMDESKTAFLCFIECKRDQLPRSFHSPQLARYSKLGVPVLTLSGKQSPSALVASIAAANYRPIPIQEIAAMSHLKRERLAERKKNRLSRSLAKWSDNLNFRS